MKWIWELSGWPNFEFDSHFIEQFERDFLQNAGKFNGAAQHLVASENDILKVEMLSQEAISTSSIEGEILDRDSVQSSIRKHLGLKTDTRKTPPNANGVSEMLVDIYLHFNHKLTHEMLFSWHSMLMKGRRDIGYVGEYRGHEEPMQIISGNYNSPKIFYEAPPSSIVYFEMGKYIEWFNGASKNHKIPTILFAGIAHVYFEMIHPFEDGNGRIGRALVEKALSIRLNAATLNSLSKVIELDKKAYYSAFGLCNTQLNLDKYLQVFSKLILDAQLYSYKTIEFLIIKTKYFQKFSNAFNNRQEKAILRIFEEGIGGFKGGLSAANYRAITGTSNATATRDLQELVEIGAFIKTGQLKGTRYLLEIGI